MSVKQAGCHAGTASGVLLSALLMAFGCTSHWERGTFGDLGHVESSLGGDAPPVLEGSDLEHYVAFARLNSPELRAAFERWRAQAFRISRARRLPDPTISYSYFARSVETRVGPQQHRISVRQSFPWPTKLTAGADAAALRARAQQRQFEARALALEAEVAEHYWMLWSVRRVREVRAEQLELYQHLSEIVRGRLEAGTATLAEIQQIELARSRVQDAVEALDEQEAAASAALVGVLGAPPGTETPTSRAPPSIGLPAEDNERLRAAVEAHPAVQIFVELASASDAMAESVRGARFPSFTLGLDWIQTGNAIAPNTPGDGNDPVVLSLGLSVPLWQGSYADEVRAERAQADSFRADTRASQDRRVAQLESRLAMVRDAVRQYRLYRDRLRPQALTLHESVVSAYTVGRASVADLLMAERDLLEIRESEIRAAAVYATEWARVEALAGRPVQRTMLNGDPP